VACRNCSIGCESQRRASRDQAQRQGGAGNQSRVKADSTPFIRESSMPMRPGTWLKYAPVELLPLLAAYALNSGRTIRDIEARTVTVRLNLQLPTS
jgi:hypothetical protein